MNGKLTPTMKETYELLKSAGKLYKSTKCANTPSVFTLFDRKDLNSHDLYKSGWNKTANRQSLNRLVQVGLARYIDKEMTIIELTGPCEKCAEGAVKQEFCIDIKFDQRIRGMIEVKGDYCPHCGWHIREENENG